VAKLQSPDRQDDANDDCQDLSAQNTVDKSFGEWEDAGFGFSRRTALGKPSRIKLEGPLGFGGAYKGLGKGKMRGHAYLRVAIV
jgi:hypothetical protein